MSKVSGLGDFAICFDGCMRAVRAYLEGKMEAGGKSPEEIFMFYANEVTAVVEIRSSWARRCMRLRT